MRTVRDSLILVVLLLAGCRSPQPEGQNMTQLPRCELQQDIHKLSGSRVRVVGTYHQVDMRMRPKPPPQYRGHAAVRLADGTQVLLEPAWSKAALRSPEERMLYEGKRVEVTGIIHARSPSPPEPAAHPINPTLSPVEAIQPAE